MMFTMWMLQAIQIMGHSIFALSRDTFYYKRFT